MSDQSITTQFGVTYPNGVTEWATEAWFGAIDTPEKRATFQEQYNLKLQSLGVPGQGLSFVTREVTSTYGAPTALVDIIIDPEEQSE